MSDEPEMRYGFFVYVALNRYTAWTEVEHCKTYEEAKAKAIARPESLIRVYNEQNEVVFFELRQSRG